MSDGERLLVIMGQRIAIVNASTGETNDIYVDPNAAIARYGIDLAPDDSFLLYAVSVTESDIWMMEFDQPVQP